MIDRNRRALLLAGASTSLAGLVPAAALAQSDYPTKPIRIVVPFPAGGATDIVARLVGEKMSKEFGQAVVVENRGGAGGQVGAEAVQRAANDGYTLLVTNTGFLQAPLLATKPIYDPVKDFEAVSQLNLAPNSFVINPALPANNLQEFIALVKREPKKHSFGSGGIAQTLHLFGEMLNKAAGLDMVHAPFQGEVLAVNAILAGQVSCSFITVASSQAQIKAGKLRALGVTGPTRTSLLPDVPTFKEQGYPQFDAVGWYGMLAPAGTPKAIVDKLSRAAAAAIRQPDVSSRLNDLALTPVGSTADEHAAAIRRGLVEWKSIMTVTGMMPK
ncbi:Bug family tripartite tricarboxylate transporter substrate binding protein [Ramlibacter sp.]|uniref:Bug family tripartite tricarboxylate transporter substrate binding protein n=1 Tax=Ramlibacter sp. TaxID=1917967 RepID=UPI003D0D7616